MDNLINLLITTCLRMENSIIETIQQGGQWELWLHIELAKALARRGITVNREMPYGPGKESMDFSVLWGGTQYAIEIKVESAAVPGTIRKDRLRGRNAGEFGAAWSEQVGGDIFKLQGYQPHDESIQRLVVLIGYSSRVVELMRALSRDTPPSHLSLGDAEFEHRGKAGFKLSIGVYYADAY